MKPTKIIVHCSATPNGKPVDISEIRRWHVEQNGWSDVGYHLVINVDGEPMRGRSLNEPGAHCSGQNHDSLGVCLVGTDRFSKAQWRTLRSWLDVVCMTHAIPQWEIYCHRQFPSAIRQGKTCPGVEPNHLAYWLASEDDRAIKEHILREA